MIRNTYVYLECNSEIALCYDVYNREMEKTLLEAWQYFPVLTVTGPRQSGKST